MAETSDKTPPPKRRLHFLLPCFGSSPKVRTEKNPVTMEPGKGRPNRRISWLGFRMKKSAATVPVDAAVPEITASCDDGFLSPKLKKSKPMKFKAPADEVEIIVASGSESTRPSRCKTEASQTRKKTESNSTRPESSQPDSAAEKLPSSTRTAALLHSVSLPSRSLNRRKHLKKSVSQLQAVPVSSDQRQMAPKPSTNSAARIGSPGQAKPRKKFDPVIIMAAVAIMVLWGRLCAIFCTAALFYFGRLLRSEVEPEDGGGERWVLNREAAI